jgi:predicted acyltransferase
VVAQGKERLVSLDVFRGITIAMMVLVNNPGTWGAMYHPLGHAKWDGFTPTDFIFPFFLFIVGVAMTFSFDRRLREGANRFLLMEQVARRSITLVMLGLILQGFPNLRLTGPFILTIIGVTLFWPERREGESRSSACPAPTRLAKTD